MPNRGSQPLPSSAPLYAQWVPDDNRGVERTVALMQTLIREGAAQPALINLARAITRGTRHPLDRIRAWVGRHVYFTRDPIDLELLVTPGGMVESIRRFGAVSGDCDEIAVLAATLARAVGYQTRLTLFAFDSGGMWAHVFAEAFDDGGGRWVEFDTSREAQRIPADFQPARVRYVNL